MLLLLFKKGIDIVEIRNSVNQQRVVNDGIFCWGGVEVRILIVVNDYFNSYNELWHTNRFMSRTRKVKGCHV